MHYTTLLSTLLSLSTFATSAPTSSLPTLTPAFNVTIHLGKPLKPITTTSGTRNIEPITSGTVTGLLTGTITAGIAAPILTTNGTIARVETELYGVINGTGESFFVRETGVGSVPSQWTRLEIEVGGRPEFENEFFIAQTQMSADKKSVEVMGWVV